MFERFTDRARRVVVLAQEESRLLNHNYIGTEHILLGLLGDSQGVAGQALASLGITLEGARAKVREIIGEGESAPASHIPFTPRAKKILELSLREARKLNHHYIGTEHILLGLVREREGVGAQILWSHPLTAEQVRESVLQLLPGPGEVARRRGTREADLAHMTPWTPPPRPDQVGELTRVVPIARSLELDEGYRLILISLEVWSDWFDLRFALVATGETTGPEAGKPPPSLLRDRWRLSDDVGTSYQPLVTSFSAGSVMHAGQQSFSPPPPPDAEVLTVVLADQAGEELARADVPLDAADPG